MRWKDVQAHYRKLFYQGKRERQLTQAAIATAAGLAQPDVSRLMSMEGDDGPQVDTLLRAVEGLGISVSEFFSQIERRTNGDLLPSVGASRTAHVPQGVAQHGEDRPVPLDPTALRKAGTALVDAGTLFIAASEGVGPVKSRPRQSHPTRDRSSGTRKRAGGGR
jgi:DNA-binding phage protein